MPTNKRNFEPADPWFLIVDRREGGKYSPQDTAPHQLAEDLPQNLRGHEPVYGRLDDIETAMVLSDSFLVPVYLLF